MKRGLVVLDPTEITPAERDQRLAALQADLRAAGVDVGLVYNDVSRGEDIGWLSNLTIYWNEGVLAVPAHGAPTLLTKLSKRVHTWMRATSTLTEIRSGRTFGDLVAGHLADHRPGTVGFVDADLWPSAILAEIGAAVPDWSALALGPLVRDRRAIPSPAEVALLHDGADALRSALDAATEPGQRIPERVAAVERIARHHGFTDVLVRNDGVDGLGTLEIAGQYRHGWLRAARTFGDPPWLDATTRAHRRALDLVRPDRPWSEVDTAARDLLRDLPPGTDVTLRWISQTDFATAAELRTATDACPRSGEVFALELEVLVPDGRRAVVGDTALATDTRPQPLTTA